MSDQIGPENSAAWLRDIILGGARLRSPDPSSVLLEQLISHYDGLPYPEQLKFQGAIVETLAAARPSEPDLLFYLLHLVAHTKPVNAPVVLRRLITSRELVYSTEALGAGLESLALATQAEYGVGPWFADFLSRRLMERPDPRTAMAALELLAFQDEVAISTAFVELCRTEEGLHYQSEFVRSSFAALRRVGMRRFYDELDKPVLGDLAADPRLSKSAFLQAFARAMDRIGTRDRGYVPLRAVVAALLADSVAPWLAQCEAGVVMDVIDRIDHVRVAAGSHKLVVRSSTNPDYVDEFVDPHLLPVVGLTMVEAGSVYLLPISDAEAAQPFLLARPPAPLSNEEADATQESLEDLLDDLVGEHAY